MIISYQKYFNEHTTIILRHPDDQEQLATELCTLDGITYVSIPSDLELPPQPDEIAASVQVVTLSDELRNRIKQASPHVALIGQRMIEQIRAKYTLDDEMFFARIGVGASSGLYKPSAGELAEMAAFGVFVEGVRDWGRAERAKLGL